MTVSELINAFVPCKLNVDRDDTVRVAKVLPSCVERYVVLTKLAKLAVDTKLAKLAVETRLTRLAVLTKFARLAVLINEPKATVER